MRPSASISSFGSAWPWLCALLLALVAHHLLLDALWRSPWVAVPAQPARAQPPSATLMHLLPVEGVKTATPPRPTADTARIQSPALRAPQPTPPPAIALPAKPPRPAPVDERAVDEPEPVAEPEPELLAVDESAAVQPQPIPVSEAASMAVTPALTAASAATAATGPLFTGLPFGIAPPVVPPPPGAIVAAQPVVASAALHFDARQGTRQGTAIWRFESAAAPVIAAAASQAASASDAAPPAEPAASSPISYQALLSVEGVRAEPIDWASSGQITAAGIAPDRMVERQHGRDARAVNFQRDKGLVTFSSTAQSQPLAAGVQDRVTWIGQLAAMVRAQPQGWQPGAVWEVPVATARGSADVWRFVAQPLQERLVAGESVRLLPLLRVPERPYDLRVVLYVSPTHGGYPVGMSWAVEPGGEPLELWLTDPLPANS